MSRTDEAQRLIQEHIDTLGEQKSQLERALGHLQGPAAVNARNTGPGVGGKARRGRNGDETAGGGERAPRGARRGEVIADLEANPNAKVAEIANRVGINPNHAQTILGNLVKQGLATKEGPRYSLVAGGGGGSDDGQ